MVKLGNLLVATFGVLLLLNVCLARQSLGVPPQMQNACNLDNLDVLQATETIKSEAGQVEYWDHNHPQLRCAGVSVSRLIIEQGGLYLPTFFTSPKVSYVVQGVGISGRVVPGCAETFMDSQPMMQGQQQGQGQQGQPWQGQGQGQQGQGQQGQGQQGQGQQGQEPQGQQQQGQQGFRDMHQKVEHVRHGDIIANTPGSAHWIYNTGDQPLIIISLLDVANYQNQLDRNPRTFRLAGNNPQGGGQQQQQQEKNLLSGFDAKVLAQALKINVRLAQELQNQQDKRGNIVRVRGPFQVVRPPLRQPYESEKWRHPRGPQDNGLEETICSMRTHENIDDPARADVYKPNVGRVTTANSLTLPILQYVRLSATRGIIQGNAMVLPKYNMNANEILYCTGGQARIQVVNDNGQNVLDQQVQKGQLVVIPQGFAYAVVSRGNNFEWISFKTHANAMISTLAGRTSALSALPLEVIANGYQVSLEEARRIKFNTLETTLTHAQSGQQQLIEQIVEA